MSFNPIADWVIIDPALIGISEFDNGYGIFVYPNPAASTVIIGNSFNNSIMILISDSRGSVVYQHTSDSRETEIQIDGFSEGVYFVSIVTNNGVSNRKLIINRTHE
jgi:hypothetical protein